MSIKSAQCLFLWLALLIFGSPSVFAKQAKLPVIEVGVDGITALGIGLSIGRQSKLLFPDIERRYDSFLSSMINQRQMKLLLTHSLPTLFKGLSQSHREEMQGVEASWSLVSNSVLGDGELSSNEYRLINFLPDLGFMPNGSGFAAFNKASKDNAPLVGRNVDWKIGPELQTLQGITVYKGEEATTVSIGFAGLVSIITGYNDQGLFLASLNATPYSPYSQSRPLPANKFASSGFDLKTLLHSKGSLKQAKKYLATKNYPNDLNILMADKRTVEVLEYSQAGGGKFRKWNSRLHANTPWGKRHQIAIVDCFALLNMPNNCQSAKNLVRWKRFQELATFNKHSPAGVSELSSIMTDTRNKRHEILNASTLHSIVFQPSNGKLYLYANLVGEHDKSPVYQAYFSFTDTLVNSEESSTSFMNFKTLSWLLIALLGIGFWFIMRNRH